MADADIPSGQQISTFVSRGKLDTMLIESAIEKGAKRIFIRCEDVEISWSAFVGQFEFVQAAGGVVVNRDKKVLFIFRHEKWDLPKGKVEDGESLDEGALREVEEECSISELNLGKKLYTSWHTYLQKGEPMLKATAWFIMGYDGDRKPSPQLIEGITDTRWLSIEELDMVRANTYPSVMDVMNAYLAGTIE